MKFCPKCGGLMYPRKENGKSVLICRSCGYKLELGGGEESAVKTYTLRKKLAHTEKEKTIIIDDESKLPEVLPKTRDVTCPRCGHNEAYYWFMQTRAADEPPTRFYKCTKCGHVWREYE